MFKKYDIKDLFKLLTIIIIISIIIVTSKYVGIIDVVFKIIGSLFPIFLAIAISFVNEPLIFKITKYIKRKYAVIIIYLFEIIFISLILFLLIPSLIEQMKKLFFELPSVYSKITKMIDNININVNLQRAIEEYSKEIINGLSNIINIIVDLGIAFVGGFFLSFDYDKFKNKIKEYLISKEMDKTYKFIKRFIPFVYKYSYCLLIDMVILWVITGISFYIAGLEYPFAFGSIIALCDLIPFIGPVIGGAPAVIVALTKSFKFAIVILIIIVLAQFIESNITKPFIMKSAIALHPLEGLIGIAIGGSLFGFLGLILSPIFIIGIKIYISLRKEEKK